MTNAIVTGAHRLRNHSQDEVSRLAGLFQILFEHYTTHHTPHSADFVQSLRLLVGVGFGACLSDNVYTLCYQSHLHHFLKYDRGNFLKHPGSLPFLAKTLANLVSLGTHSFRTVHSPACCRVFMQLLQELLHPRILHQAGQQNEAREILDWLQRRLM